jgi:hypothetical protein
MPGAIWPCAITLLPVDMFVVASACHILIFYQLVKFAKWSKNEKSGLQTRIHAKFA